MKTYSQQKVYLQWILFSKKTITHLKLLNQQQAARKTKKIYYFKILEFKVCRQEKIDKNKVIYTNQIN